MTSKKYERKEIKKIPEVNFIYLIIYYYEFSFLIFTDTFNSFK